MSEDILRILLAAIEAYDTAYEQRYRLVLAAMHYAHECGYDVGIRIDPTEPEWPCVYIELPTGQVSWHMPQHEREYDGHTTEEKYERIRRFCND